MDHKYLLGIDLGTQSLKIGIYNEKGNLLLKESVSYPTFHSNRSLSEQNPDDWWNALKKALKRANNNINLSLIDGISVCATSSTVLMTDQNYQPIIPAQCWMDQRAVAEEEEINNNTNSIVKNRLLYSGQKTSIEWMTTKSLWLKHNYDLTNKFILEQLDWINYKLTGEVVASQCNATCKWNYVKQQNGFSEEFFNEIGLEGITKHWPNRILKVGEQVGTITETVAEELGLKAGTPVFQGGIDAHIGMIGSGSLEPGHLSMIMGTSFVHLMHHEQPIFNDALWGPYDSPLIENYWLLEGGQLSCGSLISWFLNEFYTDCTNLDEIYLELDEKIKEINAGSEGLIILDSWKGNRTPYKNPYASGAFIGLTLSHTKFHIYRAILESIAFGTKNVIQTFKNSSIPVNKIIAGGGGTKNASWMQIISDVTGLPIFIPKDQETGTKGTAIIAAYGIGLYSSIKEASEQMVEMERVFEPNWVNKEKYENAFEIYRELNTLLFPIMKKLNKGREEPHELCT
ncbi:FGGY-family carbohydrate kinase [Ureibacillus sp. FSL E2-3493]|uniref:FGGY-family carbohydrate kinase n=1 Tax=Ureibacillus sp. FSL E2-3493 TaxID=2921367 RepID=UPI0031191DD8